MNDQQPQSQQQQQGFQTAVPQLPSVSQHSDAFLSQSLRSSGHRRPMSCNPFDGPIKVPVASGHGHRPRHRRVQSFVPQSIPLTPITVPNSNRSIGHCFQPQAPTSPISASFRRQDLSPKPPCYSPTNNNSTNNNSTSMPYRRRVNIPVIEDDDDLSAVSPLGCGSIRPNPNYDPAKDPMRVNRPFIPPLEITVKTMVPIPDWLRMDAEISIPSLSSSHHSSTTSKPSMASRQKSTHTAQTEATTSYVINGKPVLVSPRHVRKPSNISIGSIVGQSSLHTSPTEDSSYDSKFGHSERKSIVRSEFKHFIGKMPLFRSSEKQKDINLQRARGCLT